MISVPSLPATVRCDEEGCAAQLPAELVLLATGGFGFRPLSVAEIKTWQVGVTQNGQYATFCDTHSKKVMRPQVGPAGVGNGKLLEVKRGH